MVGKQARVNDRSNRDNVISVGEKFKHPRVNDRSNRDSHKVRSHWLECSMNRVSDGDRSTLLSFVSCGALQNDEIIGILKVLFRYGIGTRLAMCSVNWMEARVFAILVPDPIAFAPWPGENL